MMYRIITSFLIFWLAMMSFHFTKAQKSSVSSLSKKAQPLYQYINNYANACNHYDKLFLNLNLFNQKIVDLQHEAESLASSSSQIIISMINEQVLNKIDSVQLLCDDYNFDIQLKKVRQKLLEKKAYEDSLLQKTLLDSLAREKSKWGSLIQKYLIDTSGVIKMNIRGVDYTFFITDTALHTIDLHFYSKKDSSTFKTLLNLNGHLDRIFPGKVLMITNAGMFTPSLDPEGLYISGTRDTIFDLDRGGHNDDLNFYMKPNGVFFCDKKGLPYVVTTEEWLQRKLDTSTVFCATQSGPMLLVNGSPHSNFRPVSENRKIRSGVGIVDEKPGKAVFAITNDVSNFIDFAEVLQYFFGCRDALFLDGAISKMYLKGHENVNESFFGPMISVIAK